MPQDKLSLDLAVLMKNIQIPEEVATRIANAIETDRSSMETTREKEQSSLNQRLSLTPTLMDESFEEKLLGNVDDGVYERKMQWREEEMRLKAALEAVSTPLDTRIMCSRREDFRTRAKCSFSVH